jgi:catechol 2,3-dioxygenase-like lactoylglutathione lyase family enzyme
MDAPRRFNSALTCERFSFYEVIIRMRIQFKRLDHVQLTIPFGMEDRAREFYGRLLGLEEIEKPEPLRPNGGLWFKVADIQLHISPEEVQSQSKRHPAFEVADVLDVKEFLRERGVRVRDETPLPGIERFSLFDPFGNRIEIMGESGENG